MVPIHIINLEHRQDRKSKMLIQLSEHHIDDFMFWKGVKGKDLNIDQMICDGTIKPKDRILRHGEYGCYLSHLNVMNWILLSNEEFHIVLEDDVCLCRNFMKRFNFLMGCLQKLDWDIFYLGMHNTRPEQKLGVRFGHGIYEPTVKSWGTHAYLIKKHTVKKIIDRMLPIVLPWDVALMDMKDFKRLGLISPIVHISDFSDSDTLYDLSLTDLNNNIH